MNKFSKASQKKNNKKPNSGNFLVVSEYFNFRTLQKKYMLLELFEFQQVVIGAFLINWDNFDQKVNF